MTIKTASERPMPGAVATTAESVSDRPTTRPDAGGGILVVRCTRWFAERISTLVPVGDVLECDEAQFDATATRNRPAAIVLPREVFDADPTHYREVAKAVGAMLIGIPNEHVPTKPLQKALLKAIGAD